jgi:hypothetical protein
LVSPIEVQSRDAQNPKKGKPSQGNQTPSGHVLQPIVPKTVVAEELRQSNPERNEASGGNGPPCPKKGTQRNEASSLLIKDATSDQESRDAIGTDIWGPVLWDHRSYLVFVFPPPAEEIGGDGREADNKQKGAQGRQPTSEGHSAPHKNPCRDNQPQCVMPMIGQESQHVALWRWHQW